MRTASRHAAVILVALAALSFFASPMGEARPRKHGPAEDEKDRPRLRLTADRMVGFTPLSVVLTGQLTGVNPQDGNFCHAAVTWTRIDPGQTEEEGSRVREKPACLHPHEEIVVLTSFTKDYTLYAPGSYLFRLAVEGKDGKRIFSGYAKIEVLRIE